jgi:putative colanic acid biosynthesis acetyltransferase WcaF
VSNEVNLSKYDNKWYNPGRNFIVRFLWLLSNAFLVQCKWNPSSFLRIFILRLFGAKVGSSVVIKPGVNIKYPWYLSIGDFVWIGEDVWIDNLTSISIGNNVCISQGAYLFTGNHDFKKITFDLIVNPITIQDGVWLGAKSIVCPGVIISSHAVLTVGSIATKNLMAYTIYSGIPALPLKERVIQ